MVMETVPSGTILHAHYRIERVLGSGGFGHVYLAVDLRTNQQYALKEYLVTGSGGQAQLQHEARVLSQLHHPSLPLFQEAFNERGRYYVVLSYIEGSDLTDHIRIARQSNNVIPLARTIGWVLSMCDAVIFLHDQHPPVIHRDIKPDNIRIRPDGTAVLVDLGNAKATADGARTLFFIRHQGTPGYAPPEQYPGGSGTDVRSDVYALGGTLYFALTTREPPSVSTRNQSLQQRLPDLPSLQEQLANNPPEESEASNPARQFRLGVSKPGKPAPRHSRQVAQLGTLSPALLDQLNHVIQRAMAMKPNDRYQSVADLSNDLRKVMQALPTSPAGPSRPVDPHSTQPDLPLLYNTIQAAKESQEQASQNIPPASPSPTPPAPVSPSADPPPPTLKCPRCGSPVVPKAAFCPRCGTSVSNINIAQSTTPPSSSPPEANPGNPTMQNSAPSRTISSEPTMVVRPQAPQMQTPVQPARAYPPTPSPYASPASPSRSAVENMPPRTSNSPVQNSASPTSVPPASFLPSASSIRGTPPVSQTPPASQTSAAEMNSPSPRSTGSTIPPKVIVITAVSLIVLIAVLVILVILVTRR